MIKQFLGIINSEFKDYNRRKFLQDLMAGITVAAVALPLALAFGVSSGTTAAAGLITAIVAGLIISSLSGAFYQISGPTGAMAAILISLIGKYGMNGIFIATFMAGIFLLLAGIFRLGNLISLIPSPVITGFTSGIAIIIASGQIKNFFGIEHFTGSFFDLMKFISGLHIDYPSTIIGLLTILLMIFYPKSWGKKFPASLLAILLSTLAVLVLKLDIPLVGKIPTTLIPQAHLRLTELNLQDMKTLLIPAISITVLGMTESLLCGASAGRATNHPMDNNQELVAQGIGNIFIPFFGGIPATAAIARTSVAIKAGAQTRLTGIIHALILLLSMFLFAPFMTHIPLSALAGVLIMTAVRMNEWEAIRFLFKNKLKSGIIEFFVTMIITVIFDLSTAILAGIIVGFLLFIVKISQIEINSSQIEPERISQNHHEVFTDWTVIYISGPLFFLNSSKLKQAIDELPANTNVVLSLRGVPMIDVTSIKLLIDIYSIFHKEERQIVFASMNPKLKESFKRTGLISMVGEEAIYPSVNEFLLDLVDKNK